MGARLGWRCAEWRYTTVLLSRITSFTGTGNGYVSNERKGSRDRLGGQQTLASHLLRRHTWYINVFKEFCNSEDLLHFWTYHCSLKYSTSAHCLLTFMLPLQTIPRSFVVVYRTQFFTRLEHDEFVPPNSPTGFPTVRQQNTDPFSRVDSECYGQIYGKGPRTII